MTMFESIVNNSCALCALIDPKIIQQTNMPAYSKAVFTWLTGINTIIADRQISANSPFAL